MWGHCSFILGPEVMLKILQARLQQYVNCELPDVQAGFRKDRGTRDQIANMCWIIEKAERSRKTPTSALLITPKPLCGSQQNVENSSRNGNTRPPYLSPEKSLRRPISNRAGKEQQTGSKLGKEYIKPMYCHRAYLTYMRSTSCEMLGWMKHKLESRFQEKCQ